MNYSIIGPVYPYRGGIAHHTTMLDKALRGAGHSTQVISFARQFPGWLYPGESDKDPSQHPIETEADFILDPFFPWTWLQASRSIRSFNPDNVILQWWTTFWAVPYRVICQTLRNRQYPIIYMIHNVSPHEKRIWDTWLVKTGLSGADHFIVQNPRERSRLLDVIPGAKVSVCPMPVYSSLAEKRMDRSEARVELNLPQNAFVLLFFGIVRPYKGLRILIEALGHLAADEGYPYLIVAGEFWEDKSMYFELIDQLHLQDKVIIDDRYVPNEQVNIYFSAADILVAPYTAGTQSAVASLALSYGIPLIVTEQIADGINQSLMESVHVIKAGDPVLLANAIKGEINNQKIEDSRSRFAADDWARMIEIIEEISG